MASRSSGNGLHLANLGNLGWPSEAILTPDWVLECRVELVLLTLAMPLDLTPAKGLLFRITHVRNLPWLLANGLPCAHSGVRDPDFVEIGKPDLIQDRKRRRVTLPPYGTLANYVPFYLTPRSPMLLNIKTGWNGVTTRTNAEIAILVSSLGRMQKCGVSLLFTDRHAYMATARWSADPADIETMIDWTILQQHDFARSDRYPDKMDRYQAEALAHNHVPVDALLGIGCASETAFSEIEALVKTMGLPLRVVVRPEWYF